MEIWQASILELTGRTMAAEQSSPQDTPGRDRQHVLVIDDDPLFRSLIVAVLRHDYHVTVTGDGSDGYRRALEEKPDITVLDLQMPGWDGLKTLRAFRAHPSLASARVLVLTSDASRETVLAAIHAGADDYTIKTAFSRDEFRSKVERLLARPEPDLAAKPHRPANPMSMEVRNDQDGTKSSTRQGEQRASWSGSENLLQEMIDAWE